MGGSSKAAPVGWETMARRALVCAGLAAAQIGAPREYYVGEGADRVQFAVGWTDDVRAAVARACEKVYAGRTRQECVDLMVARVERDRTLTIDIVVDGAGLRSVAVAPGDDPLKKAAVACDGLEHTGGARHARVARGRAERLSVVTTSYPSPRRGPSPSSAA